MSLRGLKESEQRAEQLLASYLSPGQLEDWKRNRGFDVHGSNGRLYRINPMRANSWDAVVRDDGWGTDVYPCGLKLAADWALAMMLHLKAHASEVERSGCHDGRRQTEYRPQPGRYVRYAA